MIALITALITLAILGICFGFGYIMNPTNTTEYNYKASELWEAPAHWKQWKNY